MILMQTQTLMCFTHVQHVCVCLSTENPSKSKQVNFVTFLKQISFYIEEKSTKITSSATSV